MLQSARTFFQDRDVLEVDCPALSSAAPIDLHIDVMKVHLKTGQLAYLHTSTEYGMKRLLAAQIGDIYQISHVFREGEIGPLHNPEFTMAEWYRIGFSFEEMIDETLDFIRLFLGNLSKQSMSYRQTLLEFLGIDYTTLSSYQLFQYAQEHHLNLPEDGKNWDSDTLLQLLITFLVEPQLGKDHLFVLSDFPPTQAALAKTITDAGGQRVACRFEVYYKGIELANGYHELTDPIEQRRRFEEGNRARLQAGKDPLKIDEKLLNALDEGLPDCCGVAVGFDRLMLLKVGQNHIKNVIPFSWEES